MDGEMEAYAAQICFSIVPVQRVGYIRQSITSTNMQFKILYSSNPNILMFSLHFQYAERGVDTKLLSIAVKLWQQSVNQINGVQSYSKVCQKLCPAGCLNLLMTATPVPLKG